MLLTERKFKDGRESALRGPAGAGRRMDGDGRGSRRRELPHGHPFLLRETGLAPSLREDWSDAMKGARSCCPLPQDSLKSHCFPQSRREELLNGKE